MSCVNKPYQDRDQSIINAIQGDDWVLLREISLLPGGFGSHLRWRTWEYLLDVSSDDFSKKEEAATPISTMSGIHVNDLDCLSTLAEKSSAGFDLEDEKAHPDEHQVGLDTNRSFVAYPENDGPRERDLKKAQLNKLITAVLRRRRKLNYFQGYHDVAAVLYLTEKSGKSAQESDISPTLVSALEKISLHRLRDSMGTGLDPLVGLLRILKRLFRAEDRQLATIIEQSSPLPYFALSNLLTLLSHDIPTLPLIQRTFDFLLCRPPVYVIYLSAAIVLNRKEHILKMSQEGEDGAMHSILAELPDMVADGMKEEERESRLTSISSLGSDSSRSPSSDNRPSVKRVSSEHWEQVGQGSSSITHATTQDFNSSDEPSSLTSSTSPSVTEEMDSSHSTSLLPSVSTSALEHAQPTGALAGIPISSIFRDTEDLYRRFPPQDPAIGASDIMGPNSVIFTWKDNSERIANTSCSGESEKFRSSHLTTRPVLPIDDEAEDMVLETLSVVHPYDPSEEQALEEEYIPPSHNPKKRRVLVNIDRKTALAGIVLLVGVGIAMYTTDGRTSGQALEEEWKKVAGWAGSVLLSGVGHGFDNEF
ncbi:hypothetical protein FRC03_008010 [Tulasnella sp. 419]|nr:hypothetical protein FRC03_008010 [Tulasnella sp. 419]